MAIVMLTAGVMIQVTETYDQIRALMGAGAVAELHAPSGEPVSVPRASLAATASTADALRPVYAPPIEET